MNDILILGDDSTTLGLLSTLFKTEGYEVVVASSLDQCWESLDQDECRLLFVDLDQPCNVVADFAADMSERHESMQIMVGCAKGRGDRHCFDVRLPEVVVVDKPFKIDRLLETVQNVIERTELDEAESLTDAVDLSLFYQCADLIAKSSAMQDVLRLVERIAATDIPVLIGGEQGTDKTLLARAIHVRSRHADKAFVAVECRQDPDSVRSVVFDANGSDPAALKKADGGTIFLNDIELLPVDDQRRIAHLVQSSRTSGNSRRTRFIVGSTQPAEALSESGVLPELASLVSGLSIMVPPLRERCEDIPLIIAQLVDESSGFDFQGATPNFDADALSLLCSAPWPGNLPQLANVVHRLLASTDGIITAEQVRALDFLQKT